MQLPEGPPRRIARIPENVRSGRAQHEDPYAWSTHSLRRTHPRSRVLANRDNEEPLSYGVHGYSKTSVWAAVATLVTTSGRRPFRTFSRVRGLDALRNVVIRGRQFV